MRLWNRCNRFISRSCEPTRPHLQKAQMMVAVGHVIQLGHACIRVASGRHLGAGRHLEDHWETRWALGKTQITVLSAPVAHGTTRVGETRQTSTLMGIESNLERSLSKFAHIITCYAQKCCEEPWLCDGGGRSCDPTLPHPQKAHMLVRLGNDHKAAPGIENNIGTNLLEIMV